MLAMIISTSQSLASIRFDCMYVCLPCYTVSKLFIPHICHRDLEMEDTIIFVKWV